MSKATASSDPMPTPQEMKFIRLIISKQAGTPKIDWEAFAPQVGLKDGRTACVRWSQIRKRLRLNAEDGNEDTVKQAKSPAVKATPKKRQRKQAKDSIPSPVSDKPAAWKHEEEQESPSAAKKARITPGRKTKGAVGGGCSLFSESSLESAPLNSEHEFQTDSDDYSD